MIALMSIHAQRSAESGGNGYDRPRSVAHFYDLLWSVSPPLKVSTYT